MAKKHTCTQASFKKDVKTHKMIIEQDNDVHRSILFKTEGTNSYYFRIVTYPGGLMITGDMGTYVFERVHDMFDFFIIDKRDFNYKKGLAINDHYWAEKVQAVDKHSSIMAFSNEIFAKAIIRMLEDQIEDAPVKYKKLIKKHVKEEISSVSSEEEAYHVTDCLSWSPWDDGFDDAEYAFEFDNSDFFEYDTKDFTFAYIWNLYAIVWGIQKYNKAKNAKLV